MSGYYCIISQINELLLLKHDDVWSLPYISCSENWVVEDAQKIIGDVKDRFKMKVTVLRHIQDVNYNHIYELENHDTDWTLPSESRWISYGELKDLRLEISEHYEILDTWFAESESGEVPERRSPWQIKGWIANTEKWIQEQLDLLNYHTTAPIEQMKGGWGWSSLLRIPTSLGDVYFKADFSKPPPEPSVIGLIAKQWPENVPSILAMNQDQRWMLMKNFEDRGWDNISLDHQTEVMRLFAQIQISCISQLSDWQHLDCPDLRLDSFQKYIDQLFADTDALLLGQPDGLTKEEIAQLMALAPALKALCLQLSDYAIPDTLMHQDFRPGNIAVNDKNYIFYDWSDVVISHPFFSVTRFLNKISPPDGVDLQDPFLDHKEDAERRALRNAYLEPWCMYEPLERLTEAFTLARYLHFIYMPIKWYLELPYLEPHSPWHQTLAKSVPLLLRTLLKRKSYFEN